jgi:DNA mismatch repair protein MutS
MYDLYEKFYKEYVEKYGEKTAIFLQVGSFYELYDTVDQTTGRTHCNVRDLVDYLGIQVTVRKGDGMKGGDGLFAGVPEYTLHKWAGRLTQSGWTVVVVDQVKDRTGRVTDRAVSRILSPGTHIEAMGETDIASFIAVWFDMPQWGAAMFDLTTGVTKTAAGIIHGDIHTGWTADELVQFIQISSPREILICWRGEQLFCPDESAFRRRLGFTQALLHIQPAANQGSLEKGLVREEFLRRVYCPQTMMPLWNWLSVLEGAPEERALTSLLRFIEDHLPSSFQNLQQNIPWTPEQNMRLGNNALAQLQIITPRSQDSILGMYTSCITPMGKRGIRERLLTPSADVRVIEQRLQDVDAFISSDTTQIIRLLRGMFDLPRLHRRIKGYVADAADLVKLYMSYAYSVELLTYIEKNIPPLYTRSESALKFSVDTFMKGAFVHHIDMKKAERVDVDCGPFNSITWPEIYRIECRIEEIKKQIESVVQTCRNIAGCTDAIRMEARDKIPYGIRGTKIALASLKKNLTNMGSMVDELKDVDISQLKSGGWIDSPWLDKQNGQIISLREKLEALSITAMQHVCAEFASNEWFTSLEEYIIRIDCGQCLAREAVSRGYCRPRLVEGVSSIDVKQLRHPIIESQKTRTEYVPHNVSLGTNATNGWLVYGMNASGKSSLMKAVGIAIHLAQCGAYVPATECVISPFKALYTRILNHDNIYAGLSSFAVEMVELRDILKYADSGSIVLGDELCAGTETRSAEAIVTAGIEWFAVRDVKYIFATHLHGLLDILSDHSALKLQIWHLRVVYDAAKRRLMYERHLRCGAGSSLYGLEVARALDLPVDFIESAHKIRRKLIGSAAEEEATASNWNAHIVRRVCEQCSHPITNDLEVHHIKPRCKADGNVFRDTGLQRDDLRNLIVVCQTCHDKHHAGLLDIGPIVQTSDGPVRLSTEGSTIETAKSAEQKGKWTSEQMQQIREVIKEHPIMPPKYIVYKLNNEYDIQISEATIRKIKNTG